MSLKLRNTRNGRVLAWQVREAEGYWDRLRGLLGRRGLEEGEAFWIPNCASIHTWFMRFPIDVVFIREGRAAVVYESLGPFALAGPGGAGVDAVELPAFTLRASDTRLGDGLRWENA